MKADKNELMVRGTNQLAKRKPDCNKGFAATKKLLGDSVSLDCEIPPNRYSFFQALEDKLLPNTKIELNLEIENGTPNANMGDLSASPGLFARRRG